MLDVTVGVNKGVVNKLDLSDVLVGTASVHQKYTDMLEAACLAIIKVGRAERIRGMCVWRCPPMAAYEIMCIHELLLIRKRMVYDT